MYRSRSPSPGPAQISGYLNNLSDSAVYDTPNKTLLQSPSNLLQTPYISLTPLRPTLPPSFTKHLNITSPTMGSENILSTSTKFLLNEVDDKLSASTVIDLSRQESEDVGGLPMVPTRSRRPSLSPIESQTSSQRVRSQSVALQPAKQEKWTAKRVFKATWAYVTTVKVLPHSHSDRRLDTAI